jgi:hypothetical protein
MTSVQTACNFLVIDPVGWTADWAWGLPLIVLTVLIHVSGLGIISQRVSHGGARRAIERWHPRVAFVVLIGGATLLATCLHGIEAGIWAFSYRALGALPDSRTAMLYSLNALTSYGHTSIDLQDHWHLMGALEALNGWLLFGLSTAFLFAVIEKVSSLDRGHEHK